MKSWHEIRKRATESAQIPVEALKTEPLFRDFTQPGIYAEDANRLLQTNLVFRWRVLSHGIPAESFAAGANPVPKSDARSACAPFSFRMKTIASPGVGGEGSRRPAVRNACGQPVSQPVKTMELQLASTLPCAGPSVACGIRRRPGMHSRFHPPNEAVIWYNSITFDY